MSKYIQKECLEIPLPNSLPNKEPQQVVFLYDEYVFGVVVRAHESFHIVEYAKDGKIRYKVVQHG